MYEETFLLDVSVETLHAIHMTLKDCIGFSKSEHPYILSPISYVRERDTIRELIGTVYDQHKSLVPTKNIYSLTSDMIRLKIYYYLKILTFSQSKKYLKPTH